MLKGYTPSRTFLHSINYHFALCFRHRGKAITEEVESTLKNIKKNSMVEIGLKNIPLCTMPDHVHKFIWTTPKVISDSIIITIKNSALIIKTGTGALC